MVRAGFVASKPKQRNLYLQPWHWRMMHFPQRSFCMRTRTQTDAWEGVCCGICWWVVVIGIVGGNVELGDGVVVLQGDWSSEGWPKKCSTVLVDGEVNAEGVCEIEVVPWNGAWWGKPWCGVGAIWWLVVVCGVGHDIGVGETEAVGLAQKIRLGNFLPNS